MLMMMLMVTRGGLPSLLGRFIILIIVGWPAQLAGQVYHTHSYLDGGHSSKRVIPTQVGIQTSI